MPSAPRKPSTSWPTAVSIEARLERARRRLQETGVDGLIVSPGSDLRYLAGYDALALDRITCLAVPAHADPVLIVPALEAHEARESAAGKAGVAIASWSEIDDAAALAASHLPAVASRVAVSGRTWFDHALRFQQAFRDARLVSSAAILGALRTFKDAGEVQALRDAADSLDNVFVAIAAGDVPVLGRTEQDIYRDVITLVKAEGFVTGSGNLAAGPNSARPHHKAGDRRVCHGDALLIDIAAETPSGYWADCTRMFCVEAPPDDEFEQYCDVVDAARAAAQAAVKPGVTASAVDRAARDVIDAAGYCAQFVHRTGHGIGLDVHEPPYIASDNNEPLAQGMCFSIEPGIYLAGRHGARIEDIVTVTAVGAEPLNRTSHDLAVLTG